MGWLFAAWFLALCGAAGVAWLICDRRKRAAALVDQSLHLDNVRELWCPIQPQDVCPQRWESLQSTADPATRHCRQCHKDVHLTHSVREALEHARQGRCIAYEDGYSPMALGMPSGPKELGIACRKCSSMLWPSGTTCHKCGVDVPPHQLELLAGYLEPPRKPPRRVQPPPPDPVLLIPASAEALVKASHAIVHGREMTAEEFARRYRVAEDANGNSQSVT